MSFFPACDDVEHQVAPKTIAPDFEAPLSFGAKLVGVDGIVDYIPPKNIPSDGIYTSFTLKNGCIVAVGQADLMAVNIAPCVPTPAPCSSATTVTQSMYLYAGSGVAVTGDGSATNPYIVSVSGASSSNETTAISYIQAGNDGIIITGSGTQTDPIVASHKEVGSFDVINGMYFDRYGHLISYSEPASWGIKEIIGGTGIAVSKDTSTSIATIALEKPSNPINDTLNFGKYSITFDEYNRVHKVVENAAVSGSGAGMTISQYAHSCSGASTDFSFVLAETAYLRVEVTSSRANAIADITVKIDGREITFNTISSNQAVCVTSALYAAGTHSVRTLNSGGGSSYIFISAVWVP